MSARLVALDLPPGPAFVDAMRRVWDAGDAILPVDQRLPMPARAALLDAMRPSAVRTADGDETTLTGAVPVCSGDAAVVATSGTTGVPKGVVHTHDTLRASSIATSAALGVDPASDRWLCCLPLAHVGGLSVVVRSVHTGTPCTVLPAFDVDAVEAAARNGHTLVSLVPAALAHVDAARWRIILLGGSAMPPDLPANVVRTYGMTETGSGVVYDGRPIGGVELSIDAGEVLVRGPMLLRSYRTAEPGGAPTPDGVDPRRADGWFATGDAGSLAHDGTLTVEGRMGDVIVTGGEKVWPEPVERVLATAPGVADVAVAGRPDDRWGRRVVAFVVAVDPTDPPTLDALRSHVREQLPAYAAPHELVLLDAVPRTAIGKVRRADLP